MSTPERPWAATSRAASGRPHVDEHLGGLFARHGKPKFIRADNGREFIAAVLVQSLLSQGVQPVFVARASPQQNCYIERCNGSMRREVLNPESFSSVLEAKVVVEQWLELYNTQRAHRGLGGLTPAAYGKMARSRKDDDRREGGL